MIRDSDSSNTKRGYLKGDFEFFHLKDRKHMQFESHHHDFNKIVITLSGKTTYFIEGKAYRLQPWDILLVSSMEVHKTEVEPEEVYDRMVLWVNPFFLEKHSTPDYNLQTCFELAASEGYSLLRPEGEARKNLEQILAQLEAAWKNEDFGGRILKNAIFIQLMVYLNRYFLRNRKRKDSGDILSDRSINRIVKHINEHLAEDLSIEALSARFYLSRYYLMHRFKEYTGYSVHSYILQKRLIMASSLIKQGKAASQASLECGFGDYSSFNRAFKKMFGLSPRQHYKNTLELRRQYREGSHVSE